MRFKVDENLPKEVDGLPELHGHDARTVFEQGHAGSHDSNLTEVCKSERRVIVTLDLDFSNVRLYPPTEHAGIIVLHFEHQGWDEARDELVVATGRRRDVDSRNPILSAVGECTIGSSSAASSKRTTGAGAAASG